jgi:serralysin
VLRTSMRPALAVLVAAALAATTLLTTVSADARTADAAMNAGPPYEYTTELMGQFGTPIPLKDKAMLTRTKHGYLYRAGQQDSHLVIKQVERGLRFHDRGTKEWRELGRACKKRRVKRGVAAVCRIPSGISRRQPLLVEVWPRLGDDYLDAHTLSAKFSLTMLGDEGNDTARLGAGRDFFNGHSGRDRVWGGKGADWIRAGLGNDLVYAGPGTDRVVGMEGNDVIHGGSGADRIGGNENDDKLYGEGGADFILCGDGLDLTDLDVTDRLMDCESLLGN